MHTVFSTKDRRPLLRDTALRHELHHYLGGILKHLDCQKGMCEIDSREGDKRCSPFRVDAPIRCPPTVARRAQPWAQ